MITPREMELMRQITTITNQVTAAMKAFEQTHDWDPEAAWGELHDIVNAHHDQMKPLIRELQASVRQRREAKR